MQCPVWRCVLGAQPAVRSLWPREEAARCAALCLGRVLGASQALRQGSAHLLRARAAKGFVEDS